MTQLLLPFASRFRRVAETAARKRLSTLAIFVATRDSDTPPQPPAGQLTSGASQSTLWPEIRDARPSSLQSLVAWAGCGGAAETLSTSKLSRPAPGRPRLP